MKHIEHPDILNAAVYGYRKCCREATCPECGEVCNVLYFSKVYDRYMGCDNCMRAEEDFPELDY